MNNTIESYTQTSYITELFSHKEVILTDLECLRKKVDADAINVITEIELNPESQLEKNDKNATKEVLREYMYEILEQHGIKEDVALIYEDYQSITKIGTKRTTPCVALLDGRKITVGDSELTTSRSGDPRVGKMYIKLEDPNKGPLDDSGVIFVLGNPIPELDRNSSFASKEKMRKIEDKKDMLRAAMYLQLVDDDLSQRIGAEPIPLPTQLNPAK